MSNVRFAGRRGSGLAALALGLFSSTAALAQQAGVSTQTQEAQPQPPSLGEIIVTAQKRSESINDVGMTISAVSGDALVERGIFDTSQLSGVVPGFSFTETGYGTPVYTIRGVGFQDNTLSAPPSVSVYVDEVPLPFSIETQGAALDLERVEVLKGPQGTLFGENSTGGAINYIAAKPTSHHAAGVDASYGNFNAVDLQGFVSGPLSDTLRARLSLRSEQSGDWQYSYTRSDSVGAKDLLVGRLLLDWTPTDRLTVSINLNGSQDRSDSQAAQAYGVLAAVPSTGVIPALLTFPSAPSNDRAADWQSGRSLRGDNTFYQGSGRIDYALTPDLKLTLITAYSHYSRDQPVDTDGTPYQIFFGLETGSIGTFFQELRLTGNFGNRLNWIVGGNYQADRTFDSLYLQFPQSSTRVSLGLPVSDGANTDTQDVDTKAGYAHAEYKILDSLTLQGGVRYTDTDRNYAGCTRDAGDGGLAAVYNKLGLIYRHGAPGVVAQPGGCVTINAQTLNSGLVVASLQEQNVSWRTGLNWKPTRDVLLYANVSRGYKAGSFPTLSAAVSAQDTPVKQESILAYETGFKLTLLDRTLQLDGAAFYYDYTNKQIKGKLPDPVFGNIAGLVNVPVSTVKGLELSAVWRPVEGLTISPGATMADSRIGGNFQNYNLLGQLGHFTGEALPYAPKWTGNVDANYEWRVKGDWNAFIGSNLSFQSATNGGFGDLPIFAIKAYELLDLRTGVEAPDGHLRFSLWGRNVTDTYYWTSASHLVDTYTRFTGMPTTYGVSVSYRYR
jgi:iron complex outermembrane receptor protein